MSNQKVTIEDAIKSEWQEFEYFVDMLKEINEKVLQGHEVEHFAINLINKFLNENKEQILDIQEEILAKTIMQRTENKEFEEIIKGIIKKENKEEKLKRLGF